MNTLEPRHVFDLTGRVALVTGSSRGIGRAIAGGLAAAGAQVVTHATRQESAEAAAARIRAEGGRCRAISSDLSEPDAGRRTIALAEDAAGPLDVLVINASAQINAELADLTQEAFDLQIAVNLRATVAMLQSVLPGMAERGWGRVVSIGSVNQDAPKSVVTFYAATKAAQHNLIQSQARAYARTGVLLNTLSPGLVDTDRNAHRKTGDPEGWSAYVDAVNWMGRAGRPEEMVGAALFLASGACSFMTGQTLAVNGGI